MRRIAVRDKLFLLTTVAGAAFVSTQLACATLDFQELGRAFPTLAPSFEDQRGFFNVVRWAESVRTSEDMAVLTRMVTQSAAASEARSSEAVASSNKTKASAGAAAQALAPFHVQLAQIASFETYVHVSKTLLQCGILLFLYRLRVLSRRRAVPMLCVCFLVLLCWKMAQTCLQEILSSSTSSASSSRKTLQSMTSTGATAHNASEMHAAFLSTLFFLRFAGSIVVNCAIGRAYQRYFCAPWPETWRRVPRYLGSKDLVLTTLYYASSCVAGMSVSCAALRSLSEAALQFETVALTASLAHVVVHRMANDSASSKPKQA